MEDIFIGIVYYKVIDGRMLKLFEILIYKFILKFFINYYFEKNLNIYELF